MAEARVKLDLRLGLVEIEGDSEFVSAHLDKLLPLLKAMPSDLRQLGDVEQTSEGVVGRVPCDDEELNQRKRRVPKRPPPGTSCRSRILALKNDGFFQKQKSPSGIVAGLAEKGWTYKINQVGASLSTMFSAGEIQRTKSSADAGFAYFWDRNT